MTLAVRFRSLHAEYHTQKTTISIVKGYIYTRVYYKEVIILHLEQAMACVEIMSRYVVGWRSRQEAK